MNMCITFGTLCLVYIDPQGSNSMILTSLGIIVYDDPVSNITFEFVNNKESCRSASMLRKIVECIWFRGNHQSKDEMYNVMILNKMKLILF